MREAAKSNYTTERIGAWIYFRDSAGELYRATPTAPLDWDTGYPLDARWEAPAHMAEKWLQMARDIEAKFSQEEK